MDMSDIDIHNIFTDFSKFYDIDTHGILAVALSKLKLCLSGVMLALVPNIATNHIFIDAYCGDEKSSSPHPTAIPSIPLGRKCGNFIQSSRLVTLFRVSTTFETAYFGWDGHTYANGHGQHQCQFLR